MIVLEILILKVMADELKNSVRRSVIGEIISIKEINKDDFEEGKFRHDCRIIRVDPLNGAHLLMFTSLMISMTNTVLMRLYSQVML